MAAIVLIAIVLFTLLFASLGIDLISNIDSFVFNQLQALRTTWMDHVMVAITELGDVVVLVSLFTALLGWLLWKRRWTAAAHSCGATLFALALTQAISWSTQFIRSDELHSGIKAFSFPSSHTALSAVIYGFLAVLMAREVRASVRRLIYALFSGLIAAIAFSHLYLGGHWLSDVMGGLTFGLVWVVLLGIAYRRTAWRRSRRC